MKAILWCIFGLAGLLWATGLAGQGAPVERVLLNTDEMPVVREGRVLAPARAVAEVFEAQVEWLPQARAAVVRHARREVRLTAGSRNARVDGRLVTLDVAPAIAEGRLLVPLRFLAEALGIAIRYEAATHSVLVDTYRAGEALRVLPLFTVRGGIHVLAPQPDARISSPVRVHGQANTFEGNVVIEVQGSDGQVLGRGIATGAMGSYHPFTADVAFQPPPGIERGRLFLYSSGGREGEILHPISIPVRFASPG
jgi:hypothetical protein